MFWMWNTNSTQLLEPNRNNLKQTSKIETEPNRTEPKKIWTVAALVKVKLKLIPYLPQQNGKPLFYIY